MKITATVTSANQLDRWAAEFPKIDNDACFPVLDGRIVAQPYECFRALASSPLIQGVDALEPLVNCLACHWIRLVNQWKEGNCIERKADSVGKTIRRIESRAERGSSIRVTAVWHAVRGGTASFTLRFEDKWVVEPRPYERYFAWKMAEAAQVVSEDLEERGQKPLVLCETTRTLLAELADWKAQRDAEDAVRESNAAMYKCERRTASGYCSPCKFDCPHCKGGKCVEVTE